MGIEEAQEPAKPVTGNAYALALPQIPTTWGEAIDAFENSMVLERFLPRELIRNYVLTKRQELHYMADLTREEQVEIYLDTV
jgi:glutamine synthetase